ncbi:holin [Mycobacterium phage Anthony]|uniref:Holin n=1 Tax=Mycobacterium phage Anthony TaxID=2599857 RepID=A0A5J6TNS8_9CAUD|nr:holin [Mycobacterium phage Anthony]QFG10382.1 holin [Mycobacterium phage Anthony]
MNNSSILKFYKSGSIGLILTGIAQIWLGFKGGDPALFATGIATIAGVALPAVAGKRLDGQIKDGTFEGPVELSPVDQVINSLPVIVQTANDAVADLQRVKDAATAVAGATPVIGPLAQEAIEAITKQLKI